jgi:catechol 2,3-dioxygenase-like lactoylglutathione lyase family enzyme
MTPTYTLLYVRDVAASSAFYARRLGRDPVEASPGFALFVFETGLKIGLWRADTVQPAAAATPGATELAFALPDEQAVRAQHTRWAAEGVTIAQAPTATDFGLTFTALDPDGHRLRVFTPAG